MRNTYESDKFLAMHGPGLRSLNATVVHIKYFRFGLRRAPRTFTSTCEYSLKTGFKVCDEFHIAHTLYIDIGL